MAKTAVSVAPAPVLSTSEIDEAIKEIMQLDQQIKKEQLRYGELVRKVESQYKLIAEKGETVSGTQYKAIKIPVNSGKNNFNPESLKPFIRKIVRKAHMKMSDIFTVKKITVLNNPNVIWELEKKGFLPIEVINSCRTNFYTFKTQFKRIEAPPPQE